MKRSSFILLSLSLFASNSMPQAGAAVYTNVEYDGTTRAPFGQVDCMIEGLKHSDLE